jgi:peptidoglycan/xylan/chitin deacetylase (PgdA/CDA1 family)
MRKGEINLGSRDGSRRNLRLAGLGSDGKRALKNQIFRIYTAAARLAPKRNRIVVLLYHRVCEDLRDSVTIGVQQFEQHVRFLAENYRIARLQDLISPNPDDAGEPLIAVTFDDGYLDNYRFAAPILAKYRVHATFFVSTDHISDNLPFDHDLRKLGYGLPNMNWDQIREMFTAGFAFGSHTARHANLARIDADTARWELTRSKAALERELGLDAVMFAYPFGKRQDITAERVAQIKEAGYVCNCSAYGGINSRPIDRWNVRRIGLNHQFHIPALAARIAGWKASAGN